MKYVTGDLFWTNIDSIPNKYTYLSEDITCDALIIGGGISGAINGHYFSEAGIDTVIVDKNIIGYGSTSASTSILQYEIDTDLFQLSKMIGEEKAVACFKLCEKAVYDIEKIVNILEDPCDFSLNQCFYYTMKSSRVLLMKNEFNIRKRHGFDVMFLDKGWATERFSFPVEAGIYSKSGAAQINPYKFTHGLITESIKKGLRIFENTEVTHIIPTDDHVLVKTKNHFKIKAKKVIIATGYEGRKYIKEKISNLSRTFTIVTKPVKNFDGWHDKCIIRDNNDPYIYMRTTGDNRIIMGGEDEKVGGMNSKMANLSNEDQVSIMKYKLLLNKLRTYFPKIKDLEIDYKFSAIFGSTKDELPYIGEYEGLPNCYFSLGYGANGILYAMIAGELLRDLYQGKNRKELELFKLNR